jgi:hypothetical protein
MPEVSWDEIQDKVRTFRSSQYLYLPTLKDFVYDDACQCIYFLGSANVPMDMRDTASLSLGKGGEDTDAADASKPVGGSKHLILWCVRTDQVPLGRSASESTPSPDPPAQSIVPSDERDRTGKLKRHGGAKHRLKGLTHAWKTFAKRRSQATSSVSDREQQEPTGNDLQADMVGAKWTPLIHPDFFVGIAKKGQQAHTLEEQLMRERQRIGTVGISSFVFDSRSRVLVFSLAGTMFWVSVPKVCNCFLFFGEGPEEGWN